ncbi:MAG: cation transporter [Candidatus Brocadiales bacterium]|nr:cation transporter [Candidatus Brocadiales bacterium]
MKGIKVFIFCIIGLIVAMTAPLLTTSVYAKDKEVQLNVKGMTCNACAEEVKDALDKVKGVKKSEVSWKKELAVVTVKKGTDPNLLVSAVEEAGYEAYLADNPRKREAKKEEEREEPSRDRGTHSH